jgi:hypothetical protein
MLAMAALTRAAVPAVWLLEPSRGATVAYKDDISAYIGANCLLKHKLCDTKSIWTYTNIFSFPCNIM